MASQTVLVARAGLIHMTRSRNRLARFAASALTLGALWLASACAFATSTLAFEGGGYWIDLEIGADLAPAIASVNFHTPNDSRGIVLPKNEWDVEAFDAKRQRLVLTHRPGASGAAPFVLFVRGRLATLSIGGRRIESKFGWQQ